MNDGLLTMVEREVLGWDGVSKEPGRFHSTVYRFRGQEIGHLHRHGMADLSFPREVREELIRKGEAIPHHVVPNSRTALSHPLRDEEDLSGVLALFRLAYDFAADNAGDGTTQRNQGDERTEGRRRVMNDRSKELNKLAKDWASAELRGDTDFLGRILADDFIAVGPRGFMLTKEQWTSRHEAGNLRYEAFGLDEIEVRPYGDAAVIVCRQTAEGVYEDENGRYDIHEQFRATLVFVKQRENWRLAGLQLSPILGRP